MDFSKEEIMEDLSEETIKYTKKIDTLEVQICPELTDKDFLTNLVNTLKDIRKKVFDEYGVPLPPIKITCCDEPFSNPEIQIKILIIGYCIQEINKNEKAEDIPDIIYNTIKHNLARCITSSTIEKIYEEVQKENPTLISTLKSFTNSYAAVRRVLRELVSNYIPIHNLPLIFESILECHARYDIDNRSYWRLMSLARIELAPTFITDLLNSKREFLFFTVSEKISKYLKETDCDIFERDFLEPLSNEIKEVLEDNPYLPLVLDMNENLRQYYHYKLKFFFPDLKVVSQYEVDKANDFSPFEKKLIKTIDIPTPKKEEPTEEKKVVKKTPWIKKFFRIFTKRL